MRIPAPVPGLCGCRFVAVVLLVAGASGGIGCSGPSAPARPLAAAAPPAAERPDAPPGVPLTASPPDDPEPFLRGLVRIDPPGAVPDAPETAGAAPVVVRPAAGGLPSQIVLAARDGLPERILSRFPGVVGDPVLHPDGRHVVFACAVGQASNRELFLSRVDGTLMVRLTRNEAEDAAPWFGADGRLFWTTSRWPGGPARASASIALEEPPAGIPAICADDAARHVRMLASDDMEGRLAGTLGEALAAAYVAGCFRRFGLMPGGEDGTWFQAVDYAIGTRLGSGNACSCRVGEEILEARLGDEFLPVRFSPVGEVHAEAVAAGYGLVLPDGSEDDYTGWTVKGRVAVVLDGAPEGWRERHRAHRAAAGLRGKAEAAAKKGAVALWVVGDVTGDAAGRGPAGVPAPIPVVRVARAYWDRVLKAAGGRDVPLRVSLKTDVEPIRCASSNVVGIWPGTTDEAVVFGAHLDHIGFGLPGASLAGVTDRIHPGADDNASGVAGLLEVAQAVAAAGVSFRRAIVFVAFTGEELGLLGSGRYVSRPPIPLERTAAMINLDMVGRAGTGGLMLQGVGTSPLWEPFAERVKAEAGVAVTIRRDAVFASDHSPFLARRIPVLFYFTGLHPQYHRPTDTADRIDAAGLAEVARWARAAAEQAAAVPDRPVFVETKPPPRSPGAKRAFLGIFPDVFATGTGVRVADVIPGGPADKAGLHEDDVIVRIGADLVAAPDHLVRLLSARKPGDEIDLTLRRDGEEITLRVTLGEQGD